MRILALDSSGLVASVAVVEKIEEEEQVIAEYTVNYKKTHSQTLLPMLDTVSDMIELDLKTNRRHRSCRRTGFIYRASHRLRHSERSGTSHEQAVGPHPDTGRTGVQSVRNRCHRVPNHGCAPRTGLHRNLRVLWK